MKFLDNTKFLLVLFFLLSGLASFGQATVNIEVNWPEWSSENRVRLFDSSNTLLASVCNPAACFNGSGNSPYNTTSSFSIPYGTDYYILLEDTWGDGWNGTGSYVRVSVDGVLTLENDGKEVTVNGNSYQLPRSLTFDITTNPTIFDPNLSVYQEFAGYVDYSSTGGTLRTQSNTINACSITTTSAGTLTTSIPPTATIDRAYLYWASSGINVDSNVTLDGNVVTADVTYRSYSAFNEGYFAGGVADVTSIIMASPDETYNFAGLTIDTSTQHCTVGTVLGGWSVIVFYSEDTLPASNVVLYNGFVGQSTAGTDFTLSGFFANGISGSKATFLTWEGDSNILGSSGGFNEQLLFNGNVLSGDGTNTGNNAYNSTNYDEFAAVPNGAETFYGFDLDTFDASPYITTGDTSATARVEVGQEFVISNAVIIKVPSNLISGNVFEDMNYGGGTGRDMATSFGVPIEGAAVELYDGSGTLLQTTTTDAVGEYLFGGMINGTFSVRVVNSSVNSTRGGGTTCSTCIPIQTLSTNFTSSTLTTVTNKVGGANPSGVDTAAGVLTNAQSVATVSITNEGAVDVDFGFNFNTIVNTNEDGQGSLEQFIVNSNNLDQTGLDIETNGIFDPAPSEDTSVFMIPSTADPLGRTADTNYTGDYFDIFITDGNPLTEITDTGTIIDGRTQTAYSGDTNTGTVGSGGSTVGVSTTTLPNYDLPEIQVHRNGGDVLKVQGSSTVIRNISIYANSNAVIRVESGSASILNNLLGVNAQGANAGIMDYGVEIIGGSMIVDGNYIATNTDAGILINGGASTIIQNNHITDNGNTACFDNITVQGGSGIIIQQNLIENAASLGIDGDGISGNITISENTIINSGQNGGTCGGNVENAGILLDGSNSTISNNIIASNEGSGIVLAGGNTSGNLISQNSIYANGTSADALGIDLDQADGSGDGVTLNDNGDSDNGPNGAGNFPIISTAYLSGTNFVVKGWSRPGATIEVFLTDVNEGSATEGDNRLGMSKDYGEGQTYIGTMVEGSGTDLDSGISSYTDVDGNSDNTNRFEFKIPLLSGMAIGDYITATATVLNSTSEFSPFGILKVRRVITNRRITYRVRPN
jgi:hypothetical protein